MTAFIEFVVRLAAAQHGAVARWQILRAGFSHDQVAGLVRGGRLHPVHFGVYAVGHPRLSPRGWMMAGVLAGGEAALLAYWSAVALWKLLGDRRGGPVHVIGPTAAPSKAPGLIIRRSRDQRKEDRAEIEGIPVTSIYRTLIDVAGQAERKQLERMFESATRLDAFDHRQLNTRLGVSRRRGTGELRRLLRVITGEAPMQRSELEKLLRHLITSSYLTRLPNLSKPKYNAMVAGFECDVVFFRERLVIEVDHYFTHGDRLAFERDRRRDAALQAAGFRVLRITEERLMHEPEQVIEDIAMLLTLPQQQPGPACVSRSQIDGK